MNIINTNNYFNWSKLNIIKKKILISLEYLDYNLLNCLLINLDLGNTEIKILFKGSYNDFSYHLDITALQYLNNIASNKIVIRRNINLNFSGVLINDSDLFIPNSVKENSLVEIDWLKQNCIISDFIKKFQTIFEFSEDLNVCYKQILNNYILHSFNLEFKIYNYVNLIKNNDTHYKQSFLYLRYNSKIKLDSSIIPQFSDFKKAAYDLPLILKKFDNLGFTFLEIGKFLLPPGKKDGAYSKYGENHSKLADSLGLVYINTSSNLRKVYLTDLGYEFLKLSTNQKNIFLKYQIYNITFIKCFFNYCLNNTINIQDFILNISDLSPSTAKRRSSSIKALIKVLISDCQNNLILSIWNNCLDIKKIKNKVKTKYILSSKDRAIILIMINKKLNKNIDFVTIESIFKSIKLHQPNLLKLNNIKNYLDLSNLLSEIFIGTEFYSNNTIVSKKILSLNNPFMYFMQKNQLINRNELIEYFIKVGYDSSSISKKFNEFEDQLIRLDFDTYMLKENFIISYEDLLIIKSIFNKLILKHSFISLLNFPSIDKLPIINYDYNHYLMASIIKHFLYNDFNLISKYSNKTYLYKYIFITHKNSFIHDFSDLLIFIIRTYYNDYDSINLKELESYLIMNNIISTSLCKSFINNSKLLIDSLNKITII